MFQTPNPAQQNEARALLALLAQDLDSKSIPETKLEKTLGSLKVLGRDVSNVSAVYDEKGIQVLGSYGFGVYSAGIRQEALRCLANALLLLPPARKYCLDCGLDKKAADFLQNADDSEEFLLCRILFLLSLHPAIDLKILIADHNLAGSIIKHLARHVDGIRTSASNDLDGQGNMALIETLKVLFNATSVNSDQISAFGGAVPELYKILNFSRLPSPPLQPPISLAINALASLDGGGTMLDNEKEIDSSTDRLLSILEDSISHHSATELEILVVPLLTVLRNINETASVHLRESMKSRLLPDFKERDQPLGKSSSLASRLLRLTTSSGMVQLSEAISGLMFELSDKDANQYVKNVGYGHAAGYLMSHKIPIPDSAKGSRPDDPSSPQIPINPITGQRLDREPANDLPEMTREEKEREAERLFVLFERLKATGVVDVKNPMDQAREDGRFEELSDEDSD